MFYPFHRSDEFEQDKFDSASTCSIRFVLFSVSAAAFILTIAGKHRSDLTITPSQGTVSKSKNFGLKLGKLKALKKGYLEWLSPRRRWGSILSPYGNLLKSFADVTSLIRNRGSASKYGGSTVDLR